MPTAQEGSSSGPCHRSTSLPGCCHCPGRPWLTRFPQDCSPQTRASACLYHTMASRDSETSPAAGLERAALEGEGDSWQRSRAPHLSCLAPPVLGKTEELSLATQVMCRTCCAQPHELPSMWHSGCTSLCQDGCSQAVKIQPVRMLASAAGTEQCWTHVHRGRRAAGEQLCRKGPGGTGHQRVQHEPAVCPGSWGISKLPFGAFDIK